MTTEITINKQPLSKLSYNTDNFKRLKEAYEAATDLIVQLNSRILLLTPPPAKADPVKVPKPSAFKKKKD